MNVCGHTDRERGRRTPHFDLLVANPALDRCYSTSKASLGAIACGRLVPSWVFACPYGWKCRM